MAITLNHTIVPARDKEASARFFADIFGLKYEGSGGYFAAVRVNDTLTLDFDDDVDVDGFGIHHYAFHVSDEEFDAILNRIQQARLAYGSEPWNLENRTLNNWNGGRGVYFRDPNGHILELLTRVPSRG
jgi:catechol 2,3-dioxygenase-like lactoylglutathione lyase family enzyme